MSKRVVHAACPHDCPDACGVLITVEDGRATRIQGDPAHPITRGFLCAKVANISIACIPRSECYIPCAGLRRRGQQHKGKAASFPKRATSSASHGSRRLKRSLNDSRTLSPSSAARQFCPTPTAALLECSTVLPWIADSFID